MRPKTTYFGIPAADFAYFNALNRESLPPWTTMTIVYDRRADGTPHFNAEAGYEPIPLEEEYERRVAWETKILPHL